MGKLLICDNVTKRFGGLVAVNRVSVEVSRGELLGLIGPNGSGKTTLVNLISGVLAPDEGRVLFEGRDITKLKPHERVALGISRIFQGMRVYPYLPVYYNVELSARSVFKDAKLARSKTIWALTTTKLLAETLELPANLTPYKIKMVELARALVTNPKLVLLDEPFAGLSPEEVSEVIEIVRKLNGNGLTFIIVEHKLRYLMKIVGRVVVLNEGRKIFDGAPSEAVNNEEVSRVYFGVV
ncbi:MAG: ABC transporter ATP-binding protein [Sulfolobales archaeon]|nr:ABC transporter ATP-binding protein [Sulfolobales archaeon]MCX8208160.1 ABC transporter ATP-binding protein [Sulfolobales archaeon]MDW8010598.1 ABC transporter ATP-binding protein [Sulfolobales archaeon]